MVPGVEPFGMAETVLVPMDHSPLARRALDFALDEYLEAELIILHVVDFVEESYAGKLLVGPEELRARGRERTEKLFDEVRETAEGHPGGLRTVLEFGQPAREIVDYAEDEEVDLIIIGSHGRSIVSRIVLGDVAQTILERASMPVTVVR